MSNERRLERAILEAMINNLGAAGFKVAAVFIDGEGCYIMRDGDTTAERVQVSSNTSQYLTADQVAATIFDVWDCLTPTIHFTAQHSTEWGDHGVMVVLGNGSDFISDWHCGNDSSPPSKQRFAAIMDAVSELASEAPLTLHIPPALNDEVLGKVG